MNATAADRTITIGPLAGACDCRDFEDWLAVARVGARMTYAWGVRLLHDRAVVAAAREASDAGEVRLHNVRRADGKGHDWIAVRLNPPVDAAMATDRSVQSGPDPASDLDDDGPLALVERQFRRCVRLGLTVPNNATIGERTGLSVNQVIYRTRQLRDAGRLTLTDMGPGQARVARVRGLNGQSAEGVPE